MHTYHIFNNSCHFKLLFSYYLIASETETEKSVNENYKYKFSALKKVQVDS